jgi:primosomal replication protein N
MWPFQNHVEIVGWIEAIHSSPAGGDYCFRLLQPGSHRHFRSAVADRDQLLEVEVWTYGSGLAELCKKNLKAGDRVQVRGRLVRVRDDEDHSMTGIEAWAIERAEPLDSFRYANQALKQGGNG